MHLRHPAHSTHNPYSLAAEHIAKYVYRTAEERIEYRHGQLAIDLFRPATKAVFADKIYCRVP